MINITELLSEAFIRRLRRGYRQNFGDVRPEFGDTIASVASDALKYISNSNALYHNMEHTVHVTLVGQDILRGKHLRDGDVSCEDWLHLIVSLLCHDIGYVKGICRNDGDDLYATGTGSERVRLPPGRTDASFMAYHVDRGKLYVEEHFSGQSEIDIAAVKSYIELTRFPFPEDEDPLDTAGYPCLARAADLIGQLSDPRYLNKIPALFYEFEETGFNDTTGYRNPADLLAHYPDFYWNTVYPYIPDALRYLSVTEEGQQIVSSLYANLYAAESLLPAAAQR